MIKKIEIQNYKSIKKADLNIKPLTILTGVNSTGKSSLIQSILLLNKLYTNNGKVLLQYLPAAFSGIRNIYERAQKIDIKITTDKGISECSITENEVKALSTNADLEIENNLYYLSANRIGAEDFPSISSDFKVGITGEYLLGTFENEKSSPIIRELVRNTDSYTLSAQVNHWLTYILSIKFELQTEKRSETKVEVKYKSDEIPNLSPFQLGMGVSYLTRIIIMCLRAKKDDVLIIENPEIHLHPAAQARLGEFFTFIVTAGIQLIIETHCEHLINRVQYEIFKKHINHSDVTLLYKAGINTPFEIIDFKNNGQYTVEFPNGFFDATLENLMEME